MSIKCEHEFVRILASACIRCTKCCHDFEERDAIRCPYTGGICMTPFKCHLHDGQYNYRDPESNRNACHCAVIRAQYQCRHELPVASCSICKPKPTVEITD